MTTCAYCTRPFTPAGRPAVYCSTRCRGRANEARRDPFPAQRLADAERDVERIKAAGASHERYLPSALIRLDSTRRRMADHEALLDRLDAASPRRSTSAAETRGPRRPHGQATRG